MSRRRRQNRADGNAADGQFWAPLVYLLGGLACVLVLAAAFPRNDVARAEEPSNEDALIARVESAKRFPEKWSDAVTALCTDPVLQAEGIAADCGTGTITFGDHLFDDSEEVQLTEEGIRKLHHAISSLLRHLRAHEEVWAQVESIELRGHADPRARRDPYVTNMRVSQRRPMAIMFYLISDWGLSERDRQDLENLLVLSAASHSRPPEACKDRSRDCYPLWRRVEITPRLKDRELVSSLQSLTNDLDDLLPDRS